MNAFSENGKFFMYGTPITATPLLDVLKSKANGISFFLVNIGPEEASKILEFNTSNRRFRQNHIDWLAKQMELGYWEFTGDAIKLADDNTLLDKQHTLMAVQKSGVKFQFLVIKGLDKKVFDVLDTGLSRTAGDVLHQHGIPNATNIAAAARRILLQKNKYFSGHSGTAIKASSDEKELISNASVLDFVHENYEAMQYAVNMGQQAYKDLNAVPTSFYTAFIFQASEIDHDGCYEFIKKTTYGIGLDKYSPMFHLRNRLIQQLTTKKKYNTRDLLYFFVYTWNKFREGEELKVLQSIRPDMSFPEMI